MNKLFESAITNLSKAAPLVLGIIFLVFGLNGFFNFFETPPVSDAGADFLAGLAAAGYFFPFLKLVEVVCGVLLLTKRYTPLVLVVLAPIVLNIVAFHVFLAPSGLLLAALLAGLYVVTCYKCRQTLRVLVEC